jgi:hypothetical protein
LVDDGTWDLGDWIAEHGAFPFGKFTDRIDSASGAFGKLVNRPYPGTVRVYTTSSARARTVHIVVLNPEELANEVIEDHTSLLIAITDPQSVGTLELPKHGLAKLLGSVLLPFLDSTAEEHQPTWTQPVAPYGKPASDLLMNRETGKQLWRCLLGKRDTPVEVIVIMDQGGSDRRGVSVALGICDVLGLSREIVFRLDDQDWKATSATKAPNEYVYGMTKYTRETIVGGGFL